MKTKSLLYALLVLVLPAMSFTPKPADDGYYAFIVVDGVWKNKTGYTSKIVHFPGYSDCNRYRDIDFFAEAKRAFSDYLKAYYTDAFPYGENNNFFVVSTTRYNQYELLKTYEQAQQRMTEWVASQKEDGYQVRFTNFSFSCSNLR